MKRTLQLALAATAAMFFSAASASAAIIVNDTWQDANRNQPAAPTYAENNGALGTDADADVDIESAWWVTPGASTAVSAGHLVFTQQAGSSSYTTHFTPNGQHLSLAQGEAIKVTWIFTPTGVGTDTGRGLRLALVTGDDTNRRTTDGSPNSSTYSGYRVSLNVAQTLPAIAIDLRERQVFTADNLLTNDDRWGANGVASAILATTGANGATGMVDGTQYTFEWTLARTFTDEIAATVKISGGNYAGTGSLTLNYTDTSANNNNFSFDTLGLRPSSLASTATTLDTTLFRIEKITIPEPASLSLAGLAGLATLALRRRR